MKKKLYYCLMAALVWGLAMNVTSCKEDDKEPSEEEKQRQAEEEADKDMTDAATFWSVVGQLTDTTMPDDWRNATYEPSIGEPDGENTAVRIISAADAESAAERFSNLVGADITEVTQDYTYQNDLVGTLTYHKTGGTSLATVDVSIKQMPGLSQIIYKSPEQIGDNSSFKGTAYYRFGDVVQKQNADGQWDYWICVRPCFGPDSKTDSHWISLSKIPSANVKNATKNTTAGKLTHVMPKSLGINKDHMQNLAELLYAMTNPTQWATNLSTNNGYKTLKFFKDFNYQKNYKYHNESFFRNVGTHMPDDVFMDIFGLTKDEMRTELQQWGLHLIHSSATMSGNDITLEMAEYNGTNLKTQRTYKNTSRWDTKVFNIYDLTRNHYIDDVTLTANRGKIWVCRYASGTTLAKGSAESPTFDKYKKLPNCRDIFVYNRDVDHLDMNDLKNIEPKVTSPDGSNKGYYRLGDIVKFQNRYYVCVSDHDTGETARFITLNDQETHTTMTFSWKHDFSMTTNDVVYNDDMASAETATLWLGNIVFKQAMCDQVRNAMRERNLSQYIYQLVPETEEARGDFMSLAVDGNQYVTNINQATELMGFAGYHFMNFKWEVLYNNPDGNFYDVWLTAPYNYLLVDKMRYSTHLIASTDHWVPYLMLMEERKLNNVRTYLQAHNDLEQQNVSGYFEWKDMGAYEAEYDWKDDHDRPQHFKETYHIVKLAHYWFHDVFLSETQGNLGFTVDYTKDWLNHPNEVTKAEFSKIPGAWSHRSITSRELTFIDDGKQQTRYQSIYVRSEQ